MAGGTPDSAAVYVAGFGPQGVLRTRIGGTRSFVDSSGGGNFFANPSGDAIKTYGYVDSTTIAANRFGLAANGTTPRPIALAAIALSASSNTTIGGADSTFGNVIAASTFGLSLAGVSGTTLVRANDFGFSADGLTG